MVTAIEIDVERGSLDLTVDQRELQTRAEVWTPPDKNVTGVLERYTAMATSAAHGGILDVSKHSSMPTPTESLK